MSVGLISRKSPAWGTADLTASTNSWRCFADSRMTTIRSVFRAIISFANCSASSWRLKSNHVTPLVRRISPPCFWAASLSSSLNTFGNSTLNCRWISPKIGSGPGNVPYCITYGFSSWATGLFFRRSKTSLFSSRIWSKAIVWRIWSSEAL